MYKGKRRKFYETKWTRKAAVYISMESEKADVINAICSFVKKTLQNVNNAEWVSIMVLVFRTY